MMRGQAAADERHVVCRVHHRKVRSNTPLASLTETFSARPSPSILGGNPAKADADGFSYWAAEPREIFEFESGGRDFFSGLQTVLDRYTLAGGAALDGRNSSLPQGMFLGGWIGYFSYELGRAIERLPETAVDDLPMPHVRLCFYDRVVAYEHRSNVFWLVAVELPEDRETPAEKIAALARCLEQAERIRPAQPPPGNIENIDLAGIRGNMSRDDYLQAVGRIKRYIYDGEVYQVNFSHRLESPFQGKPIQLFHWQNRYNPSGYAAYIGAGRFQIVSASPEMFITARNGLIQTKPIKGTRPRICACEPHAAKINAERFDDLLTSEKERAELNMIVDLERNDVARICKPGTRHVMQQRTIETYPTVFHAVATVGGQLRKDVTFEDVLKAMFPGGSITGAPKIRAMEIIDELEPTTRGVYTGSIGFISIDGTVCLNIAIRTIIISGGRAFVQTGGGIVADSDPQAEWDETMTKARALLAGIRAVQTAQPSC